MTLGALPARPVVIAKGAAGLRAAAVRRPLVRAAREGRFAPCSFRRAAPVPGRSGVCRPRVTLRRAARGMLARVPRVLLSP
jgi:hypothetical protein